MGSAAAPQGLATCRSICWSLSLGTLLAPAGSTTLPCEWTLNTAMLLLILRCVQPPHPSVFSSSCGVNRTWRWLGRALFFSAPWQVPHLICHPSQLFCLSPRPVSGSRTGLLKCFVRRESKPPGGGGTRFTFCIGWSVVGGEATAGMLEGWHTAQCAASRQPAAGPPGTCPSHQRPPNTCCRPCPCSRQGPPCTAPRALPALRRAGLPQ